MRSGVRIGMAGCVRGGLPMAKNKRKPKRFIAAREARRRARELAGSPPAQRIIPDKRLKPPKHKKRPLENDGQ